MLIDTHCHLNDAKAFPDPGSAVREAVDAGVGRMFVVGVDADDSSKAIKLAEAHPEVYAIVGWHPNYAAAYSHAGLAEIESMLAHPKAIALGEIGLDFHWDYATREQQEGALVGQLELAERTGKPVVFHCREAYPALLDLLESRAILPYLFHCFAGERGDARRAIALGASFGVDGPITYKKSVALREVIGEIPRDRIVVETDSPYLSPEPVRGKPNRPSNVRYVNAALASVLAITPEECASLTTANALRFFRIDASQTSNSIPS